MAFDLLLDQSTNDLVFNKGDLNFTPSNPIEVGQRVATLLRTWEGEWFLDTTYGIPYRQQIIAQARTSKEVDAIFVAAIAAQDGVNSIEDFTSNFDQKTRSYTAVATINTTAGTITIPVDTSPAEQYSYPIPVPSEPIASCSANSADIITYVNKLFYYINIGGLPRSTGSSTWVNTWM